MRRGEVIAQAGYDGEYGVIRVFGGASVSETQMGLFAETEEKRDAEVAENAESADTPASSDLSALSAPVRVHPRPVSEADPQPSRSTKLRAAYEAPPLTHHSSRITSSLNDQQRVAVLCTDAPLVIVAGPGTGKTRTLTVRIAHLILEKGVAPEAVLAITFTNKAAGEMRERLDGAPRRRDRGPGDDQDVSRLRRDAFAASTRRGWASAPISRSSPTKIVSRC